MVDRSRHAGSIALVSGAGSGIGAAVASRLAEDGWVVVGLDLRADATRLIYPCDVTDPRAVAEVVETVIADHGPIGAMVAAAGVWQGTDPYVYEPEGWRRMAEIYIGGAATMLRAVVPHMVGRGFGQIVTITTDLGLGGNPDDAHYVAAKGGLLALTRGAAASLLGTGVQVNTIAPGATDTPILPPDSPWRTAEVLDRLPLRRLVDPAEIAEATAYLCEPQNTLTGLIVSPNAGAVI